MALRRLVTVSAAWSVLLVGAVILTGCGGGAPATPPGGKTNKGGVFSKETFAKELAATKAAAPDAAAIKLSKLAADAFEANERDLAKEAMSLALQRVGDMTGDVPADTMVNVYTAMAPMLFKVGKRDEARDYLKKASEEAPKIEKSEAKGLALTRIAAAQNGLNMASEAAATMKKAEDLANGEQDAAAKLAMLGYAASGYQSIGKQAEAERIVKSMLEIANAATEGEDKAKLLAMVGTSQAAIGGKEAVDTFKQAREQAESVKEPLKKAFAMFDVGEKAMRAKAFKTGRETLEACRSFANNEPALKNKQSEFKVMYEDIGRLLK